MRREVFHPYSDRPKGGIWANCYAYEEAFGEKLRALGERTRPRDLYDVVNLYRHTDSRPKATVPPVVAKVHLGLLLVRPFSPTPIESS